ncbi:MULTISPECIES: pyridoxal phosphate-dependent aminotransferase [unclassified Streptomyces]|uniref:pyridoxal phosphate-dependent aminotransferase n=1 Tax=unclassified Streptomyces TaxID=2593676 RepID=UPI00136D8EDC|nr:MULTISPECIES: pyridoxal phosphate-dependent aminotransferase [unclassified Streptomyces]NEA01991.1 pyridoxal phosphate-dependent aminotransferase [Streptomyces sp. SID10116]MYY81861.1 pyridoxal phosphate-dependent aminotransferase [Streptomyces sp. SID335]MYZ13373.1 pyridoxal phosphate-dependent aminotransferase [Streptomyces sp. SID337]NDZ89967.1 pyridoxal phosphate-dependent aminotransferase [Streptomyces sp. SID10115]NEB45678.1 pyridoxal phosphate-dependent aminotransferase [Streptomyces
MAAMTSTSGSGRPLLNRRLAEFGTTIFAEMSALAVSTGAINLGQGFPDTDGPEAVREAAVRALRDGRGNQYPPGPGVPELRTAIAEHQLARYALSYDPDREVLVTAGATEAIAASLLALVEPGDEVIALEPYYDSYAASIALAGGTRVPVTLRPGDGRFRLDLDELRDAVTDRTRLILLNTPHNPTGTVLTRAELTEIARLAVERDLLVVTDEVYEHLVFDDAEHIPLATFPGMRERTVSIGSAGKTFSFTGWKVGWVTASPELVSAVRSAKQFLTYVASGPFQYAVAEALALPGSYFDDFRADMRAKRDLLSEGLTAAGFDVYRPAGTYFVTTDITPLGLADGDGFAFCRALPERAGVVAIPNAVFYDHRDAGAPFVRFAFCKKTAVLEEAVTRLKSLAG